MATAKEIHTELNPVQVSLLRLFNRPMSEEDTIALKKVMVEHYDHLLKEELSAVIADKGYTQEHFDRMLDSES